MNMLKLDYWSLKLALDTVVTYKMMDMSHKSLDAYQSHESGYYRAIGDQMYDYICTDKEFVDMAVYNEYPTFDDGSPDLTPQDRIENYLNWGSCRISPMKFITWCSDNNIDVPLEFKIHVDGTGIIVDSGKAGKSDLMLQYAIEIGAFCNENTKDDYVPTFEDVQKQMANLHGTNTVADTWIKEILSYAASDMTTKGGRPSKILTDAIKVGFNMREWYDGNSEITELEFNNNFKRDLPKATIALRSKAWEYLTKFKDTGL
jgi:hypothetical protein